MSVLIQSPIVGWLAKTEGGIERADALQVVESEATIAVIARGHSALAINRDIRDRLRRVRLHRGQPLKTPKPTPDEVQWTQISSRTREVTPDRSTSATQVTAFEREEALRLLIANRPEYTKLSEIIDSLPD